MANKRIELEQYKYYIDLLAEDPASRTWKRGVLLVMLTAILFCATIMVLGLLSNSEATSYTNILDVPVFTPGATDGMDYGSGLEFDTGYTEEPVVPMDGDIPIDGGSSLYRQEPTHRTRLAYGLPLGAGDGSLLAQAADLPETFPMDDFGTGDVDTAPSTIPTTIDRSEEPQSTGIANLSNLATGANNRGLQLYLIALFIGIAIFLYLPVRKANREGKPK